MHLVRSIDEIAEVMEGFHLFRSLSSSCSRLSCSRSLSTSDLIVETSESIELRSMVSRSRAICHQVHPEVIRKRREMELRTQKLWCEHWP